MFATLFVRLWYLQVLEHDEAEAAVNTTRLRVVETEGPRGRILDRNGVPLVDNGRSIQVAVDRQALAELDNPTQADLLRRLAEELRLDLEEQAAGRRVPNDPGPRPEAGEAPAPSTTVPLPAGVATGADEPIGATAPPVTAETLRERLEDPRYDPFVPAPVAIDISEDLEIYLHERADEFPSVVVERVGVRVHRYGALLAHVIGYVGPVSEEDLAERVDAEKPYGPNDTIGRAGVERSMEEALRGVPGRQVYEVDARNRPIREVTERRREPVAGDDVYLTIDIDLQYQVEMGLAAEIERRRGTTASDCASTCDPPGAASVAIDPRDGQVLAMASYPTFDPQLFNGGISTADYEAIADPDRADEHRNPLTNRAISGQYAPGSTFKLFSSYAGLATGLVTPEYQYNDTGIYYFSQPCSSSVCRKQNAGQDAKGIVDLARSLTVSSDTYYYRLGHQAWLQRDAIGEEALQQEMLRWGLGVRTGIDLPGEASGRIPTPDWQRDLAADLYDDPDEQEEYGRWLAGTSANTVIGQGDVLATPLQLANGYATFANGGTIYRPQLVLQVSPSMSAAARSSFTSDAVGSVPLPPEWREPILRGLDQVTKPGTGGTASATFAGFDQASCSIAGKTGTAQVAGRDDSSLFVAFAPASAPTIAISAVFEEAGFGSSAAVPFVRRVLEPTAAGCDLSLLAPAPEGGRFDVDAAIDAYQPPVVAQAD